MVTQTTRRRLLASAGTTSLVGFAGCTSGDSSDGGSGGTTTIKIVTTTESTAAYQLAQGFAAVLNKKYDDMQIDARPTAGSKQSMQQLLNGQADVAYGNIYNAFQIKNREGDYSDLSFDGNLEQLFKYYNLQAGLAATGKPPVSIADLKGTTISPGPVGTASRTVDLKVMERAGVDMNSIQLDSIQLSNQGGALNEGQVKAAADIRLNGTITPSYIEQMYSTVDAGLVKWSKKARQVVKDDPALSGGTYPAKKLKGPNYGDRSEAWWPQVVYMLWTTSKRTEALGEDVFYKLVSRIRENIDAIVEYHALAKFWKDAAFWGDFNDSIPINPGVERAFQKFEG